MFLCSTTEIVAFMFGFMFNAISCLDRWLLTYFYLNVNLEDILKIGGYMRSATHGQLTPLKMVFYTLLQFQ